MSPRQGQDLNIMGGSQFNTGGFLGGLEGFLGGLFGNSGAPYKDAMKQYEDWTRRAEGVQNPFLNMGRGAIPKFEEWLSGMKDPSGFINKLMGGYQESPYARFQQDQAIRAAGNMGSRGDMAAGGLGSTPMAQFVQQNARDISSQDMNQWLQNVLGVNTQYGSGLGSQIGWGQHAADQLTGLYGDTGRQMAEAAFGNRAGQNFDRSNIWGGLFNMGKGLFGL